MGHRLLGGTLFLTGELAAARRRLEEALSLYEQDPSLYQGMQALYAQDHKSTVLCYLALTLTLLGEIDAGLRAGETSLAHSQVLGDPHTVNYSLCFLAAVHHIRRDGEQALRRATESLEMAREQGFANWIGVSQMIRGESLMSNGACEEGLKEITLGMQAHSGIEAAAYQPFGISLLVRGLLAVSRLADASGALSRALAISERTGDRFYLPELLRLKGELLARNGKLAQAEDALRAAIEAARQQGARLFELRSAASLCKLVRGPHQAALLREVLEPVYRWFGPDVQARDVQEARTVLEDGKAA
jgi:tetratricopeptide (TPR) repeat protein